MEMNILIVDDIAENIQVLGNILEKHDYALSFALDGLQCIKMVEQNDYDLILLDVMMPHIDGFEVCRRIKQMPVKKEIPIIFLTAKSEKYDIVRGLDAGAVDYVTKPFNTKELMARVRTHIKLKAAMDNIVELNIELKQKNETLHQKNEELKAASKTIKTLTRLIPICANCKKVRDDDGYWEEVEVYIKEQVNISFSHGICPDCAKKLYPEFWEKMYEKRDT